jgi:NAD(P)H-hydrate epimerase
MGDQVSENLVRTAEGESDDPYPTVAASELGWLTKAEMIEVDRVMIEDLRIELIQMMENAGRSLARLVVDLAAPASATVYAGSGGNGGGGLVAARHLVNLGVDVAVVLSRSPANLHGVPLHQLDIITRMGVPILDAPRTSEVALDSLIGYSLRGAPRGRTADLMSAMARHSETVISLDTPSGLDLSTGRAPGATVSATATMTLALPKHGLRSQTIVGDLYLADISVPPSVLAGLGVTPPDFSQAPVVRVTT